MRNPILSEYEEIAEEAEELIAEAKMKGWALTRGSDGAFYFRGPGENDRSFCCGNAGWREAWKEVGWLLATNGRWATGLV